MDRNIFFLTIFLIHMDKTPVLCQELVINQTLVSCDGTGMVATIFNVNRTYYTGNAYAQEDNIAANAALCGPGGTAFTLDGNNWTFSITFDDMEAGKCGTYQVNGSDSEYSALLVVPRRDLIQVASDYRTIMICRWSDVETWSSTSDLSGVDPLPDTNVSRSRGSFMGPTVQAEFLDSTDTLIEERIELGERVKLKVNLSDDAIAFWTDILLTNLIAKPETPADATGLPIIQDGCPDTETFEMINGLFEDDNENDPPVLLTFDSFRFHEDVPVVFDLSVRVCSSPTTCSVTCPDSKRKKREADLDSDMFDVIILTERGHLHAHHIRERRTAPRTKTLVKGTYNDSTDGNHVDVGLQLIALVESGGDMDHTGKRVDRQEDDYLFKKEDEANFRLMNLEGKTEKPKVREEEPNRTKMITCLNQTQLIIICVLAVLMLLVTAGSTAFSCCKMLMNRDEPRRYRRVPLQNKAAQIPNHQATDIGNVARCTDCGGCTAPVEDKCTDCGCCKAPPTQQEHHIGGDKMGFIQPPGYHYELH